MNVWNLLPLLRQYSPVNSHERKALFRTAHQLRLHQRNIRAAYDRKNIRYGHITASAFVFTVSRRGEILLALQFHPKFNKWLQPGGHVEKTDSSHLDAALRESREETGLLKIVPFFVSIFDIDVHRMRDNRARNEGAHWHYDIRYLLFAEYGILRNSEESNGVKFSKLSNHIKDRRNPSMMRMARKLRTISRKPDFESRLRTARLNAANM